jgi:hypothetical protein
MRTATIPRWVYYMLVVMGVGFMAGAGAFLIFVPAPAGMIVGAIWIVMGAGMAFFSLRALARRREDEQIARTGAAATASVLGATMTGLTINNVPQWALRLRIEGYGASYETKLKLLTFTPPSDGATFSVRVDPARREHVVLAPDDPKPAAPAANPTPDVQSAVLEALRNAGLADGRTTTTVNPDGSRTITTTSVEVSGSTGDTPHDAAETVKLLAELDRLRASGVLGQDEFDMMKRKLLGES